MSAIFRKELKIYFSGLFGYVSTAILLLFAGLFSALIHLFSASADFAVTLTLMQWVLIVLIPFFSMRSIAEERHSRTDLLLYSLPLRLSEVVLGKFLAQAVLFLIPTGVMALFPLLFSTMGSINLASAYVALFGYVLMALALIALCTYLSSLVENQIVAAVLSIAALLGFYFLGSFLPLLPTASLFSLVVCLLAALGAGALMWRATKNVTLGLIIAALLVTAVSVVFLVRPEAFVNLIASFLHAVNPFTRFGGMTYGHLDLPAVLFYLTFIGVFLFLTVQSMEKRRRV